MMDNSSFKSFAYCRKQVREYCIDVGDGILLQARSHFRNNFRAGCRMLEMRNLNLDELEDAILKEGHGAVARSQLIQTCSGWH